MGKEEEEEEGRRPRGRVPTPQGRRIFHRGRFFSTTNWATSINWSSACRGQEALQAWTLLDCVHQGGGIIPSHRPTQLRQRAATAAK